MVLISARYLTKCINIGPCTKIARRNINNFRDADDTTIMAESEEEPKSLLMRVKEESKKLT